MSDRICLIVDDEPCIRAYLSLVLKERGVQSVEATNVREALGIASRLEGRLDLIITDILMPGDMDGVDLAHSVRQQFPAVPVILTSGYGDDPNIGSYGFPFIAKPFLPEKIWKVVEWVLFRRGKSRHQQLDLAGHHPCFMPFC
jgi:DNA-binding NtrC family response regulator